MRKQILVIPSATLALTLSLTCFAQDNSSDSSQLGKVIPEPFTSFENTSVEFEEAVLDTFAVALQNAPDQMGHIIIYAGRRACAGEAQVRAMRMKKYLVEYRGIEWQRVIWNDAGHLEKPYVVLEMQLRGVAPYPFTRPQALPLKDVIILNCKVKNDRRKSRGKLRRA